MLRHLLAATPTPLLLARVEDYCQAVPQAVLPRRDPAYLCLLLTGGEAQVSAAHEPHLVLANSLVFIPAGQIFAFQLGRGASGYLYRFDPALLVGLAAPDELDFRQSG